MKKCRLEGCKKTQSGGGFYCSKEHKDEDAERKRLDAERKRLQTSHEPPPQGTQPSTPWRQSPPPHAQLPTQETKKEKQAVFKPPEHSPVGDRGVMFRGSPQPEKPATNQMVKGRTSEFSDLQSQHSTSRSSAHEQTCAVRIVRHLGLKDVFVVWYHPTVSASRLIAMSQEVKDGVWEILPASRGGNVRHRFWDFYSNHKEDHPAHPESLSQPEIEFDFFGYVDAPPTTSTPLVPNWTSQRVDRKKEDSPDAERRKAVIFEVTQSQHVIYKLAQLELRLAVFLAKRRLKWGKLKLDGGKTVSIVDVVACAGLCIPESYIAEVMAFIEDKKGMAEHLPLSFELNRTNAFHVISEFEDRIGMPNVVVPPPPPATITTTFWAQLVPPAEDPTQRSKAVAFRVKPDIPDIDGLKKAVKAEMPNALKDVDAVMLKVYAHDAATGGWVEVMKASTLLAPNEEETAYHVLVP